MSENPEVSPLTASSEKLPNKQQGKGSFISRLPSLRRKKNKSPDHVVRDQSKAETRHQTSKKERKNSKRKSKKGNEAKDKMTTQFGTTKFTPYYRPPQYQGNYNGPSLQNIQMVSKTSEKVAQYEHRLTALKEQEERSNPKARPKVEREKNGCGPRVFGEEVRAKSSRFGFLGGSRSLSSSSESSSSINDENKAPLRDSTERLSAPSQSSSLIPSPTQNSSSSARTASRLPTASKTPTKSTSNGTKVYGKPLLYKSVFSSDETKHQAIKVTEIEPDNQIQASSWDRVPSQIESVNGPTDMGDVKNNSNLEVDEDKKSPNAFCNRTFGFVSEEEAPHGGNEIEQGRNRDILETPPSVVTREERINYYRSEDANEVRQDGHSDMHIESGFDRVDAKQCQQNRTIATGTSIIAKSDGTMNDVDSHTQMVYNMADGENDIQAGSISESTTVNTANESKPTSCSGRFTARRNILKTTSENEDTAALVEPDFQEVNFSTSTPMRKAQKPAIAMCDSPSKELLAAVRSKIDIAFGEKHASPRKVCKHVSIELPIEEERYDKHTDLSQGAFVNCSPERKNLKAPKFSESHPRNPKLSEIRSESIDFDCDLDSLASDDLMCDEHFFDDDDEAFLSKSAGHADLHEKSYKSGRLASRERSSSFEEKLEKRGSLRKKKKQGSYGSLPRVPKKKEETTSVDTLDELNQLMGNDKLTQRLRHLQSATRGRSHSSPSTFRPPRQLSMPIDDGDTVEIDYNSYSHMITEMTSVKTMLLRLKRVIQSSETMSPFDTSFKSSSSPLCTPCHSEPTSPVGAYKKLPPGYSLETLYQENQELRLKVLQFESKEEAWNSQREDKDREINSLKEQLRQFTQQMNKETCETAVQTDYVQSSESRFKRHQSLPPHQSPSKKDPAVQRSTSSITPQSAYIVPQQSANSVSKPTAEPQTNTRQASRLIKPQVQQNKFSPSIMALQNSKLQSTKLNTKSKNKESNLDSQKDNPMQGVTELQMQPRTDIVQNRLVEEPSARPNGDRKPPAEVSVVVQSSKSQTSSTPVISSSKHNSAHSQAKELNNVKDNTAKKNTSKVPIFQTRRSKQSPLADSPLNNELSSTLTLTNNEEQPSIDYPTPKNANKVRQPTETSSSGGRKKSRLPKPKSYNY